MATTQYRTPGVYVVEKNAFPNSVVEVATAVPLFIGYTERSRQGTIDVANTPVRLSSLREFEATFGGPARATLKFVSGSATANAPLTAADVVNAKLTFATTQRYLLHECMRLFFDNGGGPCYVVSVGGYAATPTIDKDKLWNEGIEDALKRETEPTMIVIPEATQLADADWRGVMQNVLRHCTEVMSRVAILDVVGGDKGDPKNVGTSQLILNHAAAFRQLTTDKPSYGAAYYPWLYTTILGDSSIDFRNLERTGDAGGSRELLLATVDADATKALNTKLGKLKQAATALAAKGANLTALPPAHATLLEISTPYKEQFKDKPKPEDQLTALNALSGDALAKLLSDVDAASAADCPPPPKLQVVKDAIAAITTYGTLAAMANANPDHLEAARKAATTSHAVLLTASPLYKTVMAAVRPMVNLLPPSAAMAGVYSRTDHLFGVFKAPANTGLVSVAAPSLNITHAEQEDLNVPLDGKAINAIRALPGRGLMVWGARTLDGNSQDWRYVNVRRTMIMLEQSIKAAAQAYVFQPNTASTWVTVKAMIENYLTNKWKEGALMGTTPQEAFGVEVGLGSTMSGNDVLDGYMLVTIKVAIVRPAEFIELTFVQQMQAAA